MEQNLLIKELLQAFLWIGETDRLDRPISYTNFYSTWCFLPHSVKSVLMEGVENDLILFDRTLDMGGGMMSDLGDEFAWVPRLTERGHELVSSNLGIKRRSQEEISGPYGALYWDGTSEFIESWKNIKSSPEESIRLTAEVMANGWNDSGTQIAHILDVGVSPDEIEPYVEISNPIWIPKHSPVSVIVAQVSGAFGVESAFIQGKGEPNIFWLTSEIRGPLPDEFLYSTMANHSHAEHIFSELVLGQEPPFVYCVWDDDKDQYRCMEITNGTGMTIDIEKWLGDKWNYVWPSKLFLDPLPMLTSRPDLIAKTNNVALANNVIGFTENEWAEAVDAHDHDRLTKIVRGHHELGDQVFHHLVLSAFDLELGYDWIASRRSRLKGTFPEEFIN